MAKLRAGSGKLRPASPYALPMLMAMLIAVAAGCNGREANVEAKFEDLSIDEELRVNRELLPSVPSGMVLRRDDQGVLVGAVFPACVGSDRPRLDDVALNDSGHAISIAIATSAASEPTQTAACAGIIRVDGVYVYTDDPQGVERVEVLVKAP